AWEVRGELGPYPARAGARDAGAREALRARALHRSVGARGVVPVTAALTVAHTAVRVAGARRGDRAADISRATSRKSRDPDARGRRAVEARESVWPPCPAHAHDH